MRTAAILLLLVSAASIRAEGLFPQDERTHLVTFWNAPGRWRVGPLPDVASRGPWQVRLTPDGSTWLLKYQIAAGSAAAPPTQEATAAVAPTDVWKTWVRAKIEYGITEAKTAQGHIGIKVWVNNGDYLDPEEANDAANAQTGKVSKKPARQGKR